jgi:hypothetical protein
MTVLDLTRNVIFEYCITVPAQKPVGVYYRHESTSINLDELKVLAAILVSPDITTHELISKFSFDDMFKGDERQKEKTLALIDQYLAVLVSCKLLDVEYLTKTKLTKGRMCNKLLEQASLLKEGV